MQTHEANSIKADVGPSAAMQEDVHENVQDGTYRPWVMVACKRNGTKSQRGGGPMLVQEKTRAGSMHERHDHVGKGTKASANDVSNSGLPREAERKLSSVRILERSQVISVLQKRSNEPMTQA